MGFRQHLAMLKNRDYKYPVLATVPVSESILTGNDIVLGVESVRDGQAAISVTITEGVLTLEGMEAGAAVRIYDMRGITVAATTATTSEATIALPGAGLYIVSVLGDGNVFTAKVINR